MKKKKKKRVRVQKRRREKRISPNKKTEMNSLVRKLPKFQVPAIEKKDKKTNRRFRSFSVPQWVYVAAPVAAAVLIVLIFIFIYIKDTYTVTNIYVSGNTHYTNDEIIDMVMDNRLSHNSLYLFLKYRNKSIENIPFIEKMDVDIISPDTIKINVYEKAIAGYISYLDRYMYFDRDGIIVESSLEKTDQVPEVMGLNFNYVIMHEKLPVDNDKVFEEILDLTQLLAKHELKADRIFFDSEYNVYLYFDGIEVSIGTEDYIDEKIIHLSSVISDLEGKNGILEMKDFNDDTKNITFEEKIK